MTYLAEPSERVELRPFQRRVVEKVIADCFTAPPTTRHAAALISAPTGHGKTHIIGEIARYALENVPAVRDWDGPCRVLVLTPATVAEQTRRRLLSNHGLIDHTQDLWIVSYNSLGATLGIWFLVRKLKVIMGDTQTVYQWRRETAPPLIICDECHYLMRGSSTRTKILNAYNELIESEELKKSLGVGGGREFWQFGLSATPAARISEMEWFSVATRIPYKFGYQEEPLTTAHWPSFARDHSWDSDPSEHNQAAFKRLLKTLAPYIIKVPYQDCGDRWSIAFVDIPTPQEALFVATAYERYLKKLDELGEDLRGLEIFHIIRELCKATEWVRRRPMARLMVEAWKNGYAPSAAVIFKQSLVGLVDELVNVYGVPLEKISIVWGGLDKKAQKEAAAGIEKIGRGRRKQAKQEQEELDEDQPEEEDYLTEEEEENTEEAPPISDLNILERFKPQSQKRRQEEVDKFQRGETEFFIHTFAAGGTGLDLPQNKNELRPRYKVMGVLYSDKQFLQGNREARISSLSPTSIVIILFNNTIETTRVYQKLQAKLACLHELMGSRKSFASAFIPESHASLASQLETIENSKQTTIDINTIDVTYEDNTTDNNKTTTDFIKDNGDRQRLLAPPPEADAQLTLGGDIDSGGTSGGIQLLDQGSPGDRGLLAREEGGELDHATIQQPTDPDRSKSSLLCVERETGERSTDISNTQQGHSFNDLGGSGEGITKQTGGLCEVSSNDGSSGVLPPNPGSTLTEEEELPGEYLTW